MELILLMVHFINFIKLTSKTVNLANNNPVNLIAFICDNLKVRPNTTLNKFDFSSEWNYIGLDQPMIVPPPRMTRALCEQSCDRIKECKMIKYKYVNQYNICWMYNFSYSENIKDKFKKREGNESLNTFMKTIP